MDLVRYEVREEVQSWMLGQEVGLGEHHLLHSYFFHKNSEKNL